VPQPQVALLRGNNAPIGPLTDSQSKCVGSLGRERESVFKCFGPLTPPSLANLKSFDLRDATMRILLAIDPGLSNGVAILDQHADILLATEIVPIGEGARKRLPLAGLVDLIEQYGVTHAVVEDVSAMPRQGISSSFRFGRATGSLEGVLSALKIPTAFVRPAIWKKPLGIAGATKEGARCLALQRWPAAAHFFPRKKDHNRAEAALLGAYFVERLRVAA